MTNKELLDTIIKYSDNPNILPSTSIICQKESSVYNQIIYRFKTYNDFAQYFGKQTICKSKNKKLVS